ncbi:hypothetical protein ACVU7I_11020 [Patulibacter sp. S7RM1-6]
MDTVITVVLFVVVGFSGLIAVATLFMSGSAHDSIGRGGMAPPPTPGAETAAMRDDEVRQMLAARGRRRAARGEDAEALDDELAALLGRGGGDELPEDVVAEARSVVAARVARRRHRGQPEGDPEAELAALLESLRP